jgi:hypothetical protein
MSQFEKIILKILSGNTDNNIAFNDWVRILESLNFENRIKGSHPYLLGKWC